MKRLTKNEWDAIAEALCARLAGELDAEQPREVYESALRKVGERL